METTENHEQITGLVQAMYAEFTTKMAPALSADHKYSTAMMQRGLEILVAHFQTGQTADSALILQQDSYSAARLAKALRNRDKAVTGSADLHDRLEQDVRRRRKHGHHNDKKSRRQAGC